MLSFDEFKKVFDCLKYTRDFNVFFEKPYGLELLMELNENFVLGLDASIDEVFIKLKTASCRRDAFGRYINRLEEVGALVKTTNSRKKSMKSLTLTAEFASKTCKIFE
ncbi:hypothetical protein ACMAZE_10485 [Pseudopelagicola sp. nBUS_20]|uniref:hypothetical protein n=1 Tax=Pseudopelagicola sp. nBUS_20 TaxID=3395317 RepID=UPI003EBBA406